MKPRILLAAVAVVLGILVVVFLRPRDRDAADPAASATSSPTGAAPRSGKRAPLERALPDLGDDPAAGTAEQERLKLTPSQKRAMHRLVKTYQQAQRMVADVEDSEKTKREQEAEVFGTDREGIQAAINSNIGEIQKCYEAWLGLNPELEGRIVTNFVIDAKEEEDETAGVVSVGLREGGLGNKFAEGCVMSVLSELQFERPDEQVEVNYPFIFRRAPVAEEEE